MFNVTKKINKKLKQINLLIVSKNKKTKERVLLVKFF